MSKQNRSPMYWKVVASITGGIVLIPWAVQDVLTWTQRTALFFGIVLMSWGMAMGARHNGTGERPS